MTSTHLTSLCLSITFLTSCTTQVPGDPKHPTKSPDSGQGAGASGDTGDTADDTLDRDSDGYTAEEGDCNDEDASIHPGADEACNGVDDDCDSQIDEGLSRVWYADTDFDGFGDPTASITACDPPAHHVANADDCDDTSAGVYPGANDWCNGADDDCDGDIDEDVKDDWMLVTVDNVAGYIYEVDRHTAALTVISEVSQSGFSVNSMDVREDGTPVVHNGNPAWELMTIDICDGTLTEIGPTGITNMGGIGFANSGALYGLHAAGDEVVELNPHTGEAVSVGPIGFDLGTSGLAYDCSTETLWGADGTSNQIFRVDTLTGTATDTVSTDVPFGAVGLEFDHRTGLLLASTGSALYTIDPHTGASTHIGALATSLVDDLAYHPRCD